MKKIEVRLYVINGCPSADQALKNIYRAAEELRLQAEIWIQAIWSQEEAEKISVPGSPTIMIKWEDIDSNSVGDPCYGSRIYIQDGRFTSIPPVEMIKEALAKAAKK